MARMMGFHLTRTSCNTKIVYMRNVTITVPENVAQWAKIWAARHNSSVSRLVGELLTARMNEETAYNAAMKRYLSKKPVALQQRKSGYPNREDLYDR
jgi:hypothetical protein